MTLTNAEMERIALEFYEKHQAHLREGERSREVARDHLAVAQKTALGFGTLIRIDVHKYTAGFSQRIDIESEEVVSWYCDQFRTPATRAYSREDLIVTATAFVTPPVNARLVFSEYEDIAGEPVFTVRWHHFEDDVWVEADYIDVRLNGLTGRPFAMARRWRQLDEEWRSMSRTERTRTRSHADK